MFGLFKNKQKLGEKNSLNFLGGYEKTYRSVTNILTNETDVNPHGVNSVDRMVVYEEMLVVLVQGKEVQLPFQENGKNGNFQVSTYCSLDDTIIGAVYYDISGIKEVKITITDHMLSWKFDSCKLIHNLESVRETCAQK